MFKLPQSYYVLDFETNGLPDKSGSVDNVDVTEIGVIAYCKGIVTPIFSSLCKPVDENGVQKPQPHKIVEHTGITDEMLKDKPTSLEVMRDILPTLVRSFTPAPLIQGLVGHNIVGFDKLFLDKYCKLLSIPLIPEDVYIDTAALFKAYRIAHTKASVDWNLPQSNKDLFKWSQRILAHSWTEDKVKYNVDAAIGYLAVPLFGIEGDRHRAEYDCIVTSKILEALRSEMGL